MATARKDLTRTLKEVDRAAGLAASSNDPVDDLRKTLDVIEQSLSALVALCIAANDGVLHLRDVVADLERRGREHA